MDVSFLQTAASFPEGPLLGLDLGSKTIGVAVSLPDRSMAAPVTVIRRTKFGQDAEILLEIAAERRIVGLVIGLPVNMDGSEGPRAQSARTFGINLSKKTDLPMAFWDERLSTAAAEDELIAAGMRRERRAEIIDAHAATYILQGALDRLGAAGQSNDP